MRNKRARARLLSPGEIIVLCFLGADISFFLTRAHDPGSLACPPFLGLV
jgi:hypothetical protein